MGAMAKTDSRLGRCLVTGGTGFISSHLVRLLAEGDTVTVYDNPSMGRKEWLQYLEGHEDTDLDLKSCTIATYNVLGAMGQEGVGQLVFAPTSTVYEEVPKVIYDIGELERLGWQARHSSEEADRQATRRLLGKHDLGNESG